MLVEDRYNRVMSSDTNRRLHVTPVTVIGTVVSLGTHLSSKNGSAIDSHYKMIGNTIQLVSYISPVSLHHNWGPR